MLVTGRKAARMLDLGRETASRVLAAGLAGEPVETPAAHLYDADRVAALRARPVVDDTTPLPAACANGVLVARIDPRVPPGPPELARGPWRLSFGRWAALTVLINQHAMMPLVMTVGGFVLGGADVVGSAGAPEDRRLTLLRTRPAGDWFAAFDQHVLRTPPGFPLLFWRCRLCPPLPPR
jgi:hypothetical protein